MERCGITLVATFSGNSTIDQFENAHTADLNVVMCHRSINYVADMIEKKYGIPWIKVNFIGAEASAKSLRKIAQYFDDAELIAATEEVIEEEMAAVAQGPGGNPPACEGKTAMLFVGGSRAHHYQELFAEIGMTHGGRGLRVRPPRRLRRPPACCPRSRSTPTAATSRSCTSRPIPRSTAPALPRRSGGRWNRAA